MTFFRGTSLRPPPPVESKQPNTRYVHLNEGDQFEDDLARRIEQASALPGEPLF